MIVGLRTFQEITKVVSRRFCLFFANCVNIFCVQVITDLVLTLMIILIIDFLRDLWVRYCAVWWCWDLEEGDFVSRQCAFAYSTMMDANRFLAWLRRI